MPLPLPEKRKNSTGIPGRIVATLTKRHFVDACVIFIEKKFAPPILRRNTGHLRVDVLKMRSPTNASLTEDAESRFDNTSCCQCQIHSYSQPKEEKYSGDARNYTQIKCRGRIPKDVR
jgi:hypothetical protein